MALTNRQVGILIQNARPRFRSIIHRIEQGVTLSPVQRIALILPRRRRFAAEVPPKIGGPLDVAVGRVELHAGQLL